MKAEIYWIEDIAPYRIATMPMPQYWDGLEQQIRSLKDDGVEILVSLLTSGEVSAYKLEREAKNCEACGIEYISFPIHDGRTPESRDATLDLVRQLAALVKEGKAMAVHCLGGIGRSTLIAACVLATLGIAPEEALPRIKNSRGRDVPETSEQREWIYWFAKTLAEKS